MGEKTSHLVRENHFLKGLAKDPLTGFDTRRIFFQYFSARTKKTLGHIFSRVKGLKNHSLEESLKRFAHLDPAKAASVIQEAGKEHRAVAVGDFKVLSFFNQLGGHEMGDYVIQKVADIGESLARKQKWISSLAYGRNFDVLKWLNHHVGSPSFVFGRIGGDEIMIYSEGLWKTRGASFRFFRQWNQRASAIPDYRKKGNKKPFAVAPGIDFCPIRLEEMMHFFYQHHRLFLNQKGNPSMVKFFINVWSDLSDWGSFMVKSVLRLRELIVAERTSGLFGGSLRSSSRAYFDDLINAYGKSIFYVNASTIKFFSQIFTKQPTRWHDNEERRIPDPRFTKAVHLRKELKEFSEHARGMGEKPRDIKKLFLDYMIKEFIMIQGSVGERVLLDQGYQELTMMIRKHALASALDYLSEI